MTRRPRRPQAPRRATLGCPWTEHSVAPPCGTFSWRMSRCSRLRCPGWATAAVALTFTTTLAVAQPATPQPAPDRAHPSADKVRDAERKFAEGEKAFRSGDFGRAAD